jgi:hypothetical protein
MNIFHVLALVLFLHISYVGSESTPDNTCVEPTEAAVSLANGFFEREKFSDERTDLGLGDVSPEDIQPLAALSDSEGVCAALNDKFAHFLVAEDDLYSYASYFTVEDKYIAVFTPRLPDDVSDEEVMVTGLSFLYILDGELNQVGGSAGF